ncbi:ComF family protein [Kitasatospora sp. A2-31]|uniref:ComF family protein n=1 Tax=Kitasatospora sp. A2-31 TaxID=2916414 RepID=UPI001EEC50C9|nr:ComF family protein [Kitasatospora sp. A2-31]MCG6496373.1 ComF family protein [Kitasatospora sp. A2-31]MCG6500315.1 ComF family protein [Kitasatospora sp. A2-31]
MPPTSTPTRPQTAQGPFAHALAGLLDVLLPARCAGCGIERTQLCSVCRGALATAQPGPTALPWAHAAAPYADPVRQLLLAHKERGALRLAGPLGDALARAVRSSLGPRAGLAPLLLVPMPSAPAAVRARGHDPTLRLADAAARSLRRSGLDARSASLLRHTRPVADQAGLSAAERRRNLHGALTVLPRADCRLKGRQPVLVDDLVTTGASLAEAARALTAAGLAPKAAATVAAAVPRRGPRPG